MEYFKNTWKENHYIGEHYRVSQEQYWLMARNIQFEIALSAGHRARKPMPERPADLYPITKDELVKAEPTVLDGEDAEVFLKNMFKTQ